MVRNLNLGMELAESLGGYMNIGYLPDSFGQSKDMPKIYNGFGIQHSVFGVVCLMRLLLRENFIGKRKMVQVY